MCARPACHVPRGYETNSHYCPFFASPVPYAPPYRRSNTAHVPGMSEGEGGQTSSATKALPPGWGAYSFTASIKAMMFSGFASPGMEWAGAMMYPPSFPTSAIMRFASVRTSSGVP